MESAYADIDTCIIKRSAAEKDLEDLPLGEREILRLVSQGLLRAVFPPYRYAETVVTAECAGLRFTARGKILLDLGWKAYAEQPTESVLPDALSEGTTLTVEAVHVKEGKTVPKKHFTEDTILNSMETAGADEMPEDAERRGIGTPATRAGILEKLISSGLVERKQSQKRTCLLPTQAGNSLVTVLPEELQSPLLTAEWEHRLGEVERGTLDAAEFMDGIAALVTELAETYQPVSGWEVLFPYEQERVGSCPRCGGAVMERKKGFFCGNPDCRFVLWKDSRFFSAKKKTLTRAIAASLLAERKARLKGCWSERTGKTYDATVILEDDGEKSNYKLEFDRK